MSEKNAVLPPVEAPVTTPLPLEEPTPASEKAPKRNKFASKDKHRRKMPKWLKTLIIVVLLSAIAYGSYILIQKLIKKDDTAITTAFATTQTLEQQVSGYGTVTPKQKTEYGAKVRGTVTEVAVTAGQSVAAGDLLFVINPSELQTELTAAYSALESARSGVETARKALDALNTTAPFTGKLIESATIHQGDDLSSGLKLGKLVDDSTLTLASYFSYAYIGDIKPGMSANVSIPDSMTSVLGTVSSVDRIKKVKDGAMLFRANITIKNPGTLVAGSSAAAVLRINGADVMPAESGTLANNREQEITLQSSGKVTYTSVMDYGEYKQGQTLVSLSNTSLRPALESAQKSYDEAAKKVEELEANIHNTEIRSEIDGMVSAVMISVGDKLTASGTSVVTVSNTSSLVIDVNIDELDVSKVSVGMPVEITLDEGGEPIMGTLSYVAFEAKTTDNNGGGGWGGSVAQFPAKIDIQSDGRLLPGRNVNYKIRTTVKENVLTIPSSAVIYTESGTSAYVRKADGKKYEDAIKLPEGQVPEGFVALPIEIGVSDDQNTEIISGLSEGDEVYTTAVDNKDENNGMMGAMAVGTVNLIGR